ncbi:MAG: DUF5018 domain-containing protein, partial [Paludibacteraceae bacterium]|nr:DUF5018 domain-containing protein [Paludibacteraceae bacterium]
CESYTWNGTTYSVSGNYVAHLTNAAGCDSTATLHLTIAQPTAGEETLSAGAPFAWNGNTYTESGDYVVHLTNAAGCDSTVTLHLTILSSEAKITSFSIGTTNGTIDNESGTIAFTLPYGTDVTALTPTITLSDGATCAPSGAQDFSSPVTYTVTAEDGTHYDYTVTVNIAQNTEALITSFKIGELSATIDGDQITLHLPKGTDLTNLEPIVGISNGATLTPDTRDFSNPVVYTVTSEDGINSKEYTATITKDLNDEARLTSMTIDGHDAVIDEESKTVTVTVYKNSDLTNLDIDYTTSFGATVITDGDDYLTGVTYIIASEDGMHQSEYLLTVTKVDEEETTDFENEEANNPIVKTQYFNVSGRNIGRYMIKVDTYKNGKKKAEKFIPKN